MLNPEWSYIEKSWIEADPQYRRALAGRKARAEIRRRSRACTKGCAGTLNKTNRNTKGVVTRNRPSYFHSHKRYDVSGYTSGGYP
jgi:hypothetical protein